MPAQALCWQAQTPNPNRPGNASSGQCRAAAAYVIMFFSVNPLRIGGSPGCKQDAYRVCYFVFDADQWPGAIATAENCCWNKSEKPAMPGPGFMGAFVGAMLMMAGAAQGQVYWKRGEPVPKLEDIYGSHLSPQGHRWLTESGENYNEKWRNFRDSPMKNVTSSTANFEGGSSASTQKTASPWSSRCRWWVQRESRAGVGSGPVTRPVAPMPNSPPVADSFPSFGEKYNLKYRTHGCIPLA